MINPKRLLDELNKREDDSKRIDAILDSMILRSDIMDRTVLYFANGYAMLYDAEFKVFQIDHDGLEITVSKDGRKAIDYCISPSDSESEPDFADFSDQSEKLANKESSDAVKADDNVVPNTNTEQEN
jgi:hypothetical protein